MSTRVQLYLAFFVALVVLCHVEATLRPLKEKDTIVGAVMHVPEGCLAPQGYRNILDFNRDHAGYYASLSMIHELRSGADAFVLYYNVDGEVIATDYVLRSWTSKEINALMTARRIPRSRNRQWA